MKSSGEILKELLSWKCQLEKDISNGCLITGQQVLENVRNEILSIVWNAKANSVLPWYVEIWEDTDILEAMEEVGCGPTEKNMDMVKRLCLETFEDKTDRYQCLKMIIEENCK